MRKGRRSCSSPARWQTSAMTWRQVGGVEVQADFSLATNSCLVRPWTQREEQQT